jgi:hypothetical protein
VLGIVVGTSERDVGGHLLHFVLLDGGNRPRVFGRHPVHELAANEVVFEANGYLGALALRDPHHFGDSFFRDIERVDQDFVVGAESSRVGAEEFGELRHARVEHESRIPGDGG